MSPLHRQATRQMPHGRFRRIVRRLRLRDVDNRSGHGADEDHAALLLPRHQVLGYRTGPVVRPVEVHRHELLQPVRGVCDCVEVLGEAGRRDEMVNLAMLADYFGQGVVHGISIGDIAVV